MKITAVKKIIASAVLICATVAQAGATDNEARSLTDVRDKLKAEGCDKFIVVQAFIDGLLKEGQPFKMTYSATDVSVGGISLGEPYRSEYLAMLNDFFKFKKSIGCNAPYHVYTIGDELSTATILAPGYYSSNCQCSTPTKDEPITKAKTTTSTASQKIVYSTDGITVNGRKVSAAEEAEYKALYFGKNAVAPVGKGIVTVSGK